MTIENKLNILMLAYTHYPTDARIRREAETLVAHGHCVSIIVPKEKSTKKYYQLDGVNVIEINNLKYQGKDYLKYLISYIRFTFVARLFAPSGFMENGSMFSMPTICLISLFWLD